MKGRELKYLIKEAGLTQNQIAEMLRISRVHTGRLLADDADVEPFYEAKIIDLLKIDRLQNVATTQKPTIDTPQTQLPTNSGENSPTKAFQELEKIIEQKDKIIEQLQTTVSTLTDMIKTTTPKPPEKAVQRTVHKTPSG